MRLIDADAMNEELFYKQVGGNDSLITAESAFSMVNAQPTAYDVDKVVEQIKCMSPANYVSKDDVLKIVKGGGVDG